MPRPIRLLPLALLAIAFPALAEPTQVTVRVISQDAKFVGSSMGGAKVILRDKVTGEVMAEGLTAGGTGDTALIMNSQGRSPLRASDDAAAFTTTLDLKGPRFVTLEVTGPMDYPASAVTVTQQRWIVPGEDVTAGDGWLVELIGLVILPETAIESGRLAIKAKVSPMCGCPITPGGLWPAEEYSVEATLWAEGRKLASAPLAFETAPGGFAGSIALPEGSDGALRYTLYARNLRTGNSGMVSGAVASE
ncbi:MAG TPA: hypothetical protein VLA37_05615 [Sphingomonadaceae bacterium]|nr:hypothetical protein [Sphingomonadaceae bacterium]